MLGYRVKQDLVAAAETPRTRPEAERNSQEHVARYPPLWGGLEMKLPPQLHPQKKKMAATKGWFVFTFLMENDSQMLQEPNCAAN